MQIRQKFLALMLASTMFPISAMAQTRDLQTLDAKDIANWNAAVEFRIASFVANEDVKGSGALLLALSADGKKARINLAGVVTELNALPNALDLTCQSEGTRQAVFAYQQIRLMLKLNFTKSTSACVVQGAISIKAAQHTNRFLVKGIGK